MTEKRKPPQEELANQIIQKRAEMIRHGTKYGLADPKTVASSQDLDELLNHYEKIFQHHSNPLNN